MKTVLFILIQAMLFTSMTYSQCNLDSSLVAAYYFNQNFADSSGHGYDAYDMGVYFGTDRFGTQNAAAFYSWGYLILPDSVQFKPLTSSTVSFWMKTSEWTRMTLFEQRVGSGTPDDLNFGISFNYPFPQYIHYVYPNYNGTPFAYTSLITFSDISLNYEWHHYTMIKDINESKMEIYEDKVLIGSRQIIDTNFLVAGNLVIGRNYNHEFFFNGLLDDIKIYNRVLNQEEIDSLYSEVVIVNVKNTVSSSFPVYPNPTTGFVDIPELKNFGTVIHTEVYDNKGNLIKSYSDYKRLDLSNLATGNYFIILTNDKGRKSTAKVNKL